MVLVRISVLLLPCLFKLFQSASDLQEIAFRLYTLLLSYFQYCQHMLDPDVPSTVLQFLLLDEQDGDDMELQKVCSFYHFNVLLLICTKYHPVERIALTMVMLLMLFPQINREQAELARANFSILRKEAQPILDLVSVSFLP